MLLSRSAFVLAGSDEHHVFEAVRLAGEHIGEAGQNESGEGAPLAVSDDGVIWYDQLVRMQDDEVMDSSCGNAQLRLDEFAELLRG